jgi:hypothetical protein
LLPLHVDYLFKTGYYKEPESSPARTSLRFEDERGGFKVSKVNLPLSDGGFLEGKKIGWRKNFLCRQRKKIKEKDYRRRIFYGPRRRCTTKLCATIWRNSGAAKLLWWCTNANMGEWCSHTPTNLRCPT